MAAKVFSITNMPQLMPAKLRRHILDMAYYGQAVHIGCAFSLVEILAAVYSHHFNLDINNPTWSDADRLVMSKGHGIMAQYSCMRELGWLSDDDIRNYFKNGTRLRGLAEAGSPGIEVNGGSLGHGLPVAVGMALGAKINGDDKRIFCIVGDGEMNEGSMWESVMFAAQHRLNNLTIIIDLNGLQAMGKTEDILNMTPIRHRLESFGFLGVECDGHNVSEIDTSLKSLLRERNRPQVLVAKTVKGKGVSFMEHNNTWHYTRLTAETYAAAIAELDC